LDPGKRPQTDLGFFKELEAWPQERISELIPLVPKLYLGSKMVAKLSLAGKYVPKCNLGTRKKERLKG
jgi:hypothetical protein